MPETSDADRDSEDLRPGRPSDDDANDEVMPPLPRTVRLVLFAFGGFFLILGLVGLALPVVPQTVPLALGVAILSLASDWVYTRTRLLFSRWPRAWRVVQAIRRRVHRWLS